MERVSPFQMSVLKTPEASNLALLGARGGGKTTAALLLAARHIDQHGEDARVLIVRKTYRALQQLEDEMLDLMATYTGGDHQYNRAEKVFRWKGGTITLAAVDRVDVYRDRLQGLNVTLLIVDEVTAYNSERILRLLRSNLRARPGVPTRTIYCGNPGGPLHGRIFKNHVQGRTSHVPYDLTLDDGHTETWTTILSGPADNPFIDQAAYIRRLREACHGDPVRLAQWLYGDWVQGEGLLFPHYNPDAHLLTRVTYNPDLFEAKAAFDWGLSSPSVGLLGFRVKRAMDGLPKNSVLVVDEVTDAIFSEENLNTSSEWPPDRLAERFANMAATMASIAHRAWWTAPGA